jgi:hypothetical protein
MNFEQKVTAANELLASKGIPHQLYAPTLVKLLRRLGLKVPPPHFAGFFGTFFVTAVFFGVLWGAIMWFAWWSAHGTPPATAVAISAAIGAILGLLFAAYYRTSGRKHGIPPWDQFTP